MHYFLFVIYVPERVVNIIEHVLHGPGGKIKNSITRWLNRRLPSYTVSIYALQVLILGLEKDHTFARQELISV